MLTDNYWTAGKLHLEQIDLERQMHDAGVERFKKAQQRAIDTGEASGTAYNTRLMRELVHPMAQGIQAHLDYYDNRPGKSSQAVAKLRLLDPLTAAFITVKVLFDSIPAKETLQGTCIKLGRKIEDQVRFAKLEDTAPRYVKAIQDSLKKAHSKSYRHSRNVLAESERKVAETVRGDYVNDLSRWLDWNKKDCLGLGLALAEVAQQCLAYNDEPVFTLAQEGKRATYHLEVSASVQAWIGEYTDFMSQLSPDYTPCVIPPRDWTHPKRGGYFTREVSRALPLVKVNRRRHLERLTYEQMPEVYDAVNALQRVPWRVNQSVLAVAEEIMERDLALGMPQKEPYEIAPAPVPAELHGLRGAELREAMGEREYAAFKQWKVESSLLHRKERLRRAQCYEVRRVVDHARRFSIYPGLYFVYTLDSRGRVYCRSSLLGPQGGDIQKALVHFGEALPLGERGRYWLAVHGAGVWGNDKVSFDERVRFIEEDMRETIKDIVADPCTFRDWTSADKPWQFLAWCFEWSALLEHTAAGNESGTFQSSLPVAMDGSCSGIQHYSAMLRDKRGGAAVNLTPGEAPSDIYGEVAKVVQAKLREIVAGAEIEVRTQGKIVEEDRVARMAQAWLDFGVSRKLCKKPVMTLPLTA
nr:T3/T7-like RNA polymerase [Virgibacillus halodenitrificans]